MYKPLPSSKRLKELFFLKDGELYYNKSRRGIAARQKVSINPNVKRLWLMIDGERYLSSRLIYKLANGYCPVDKVIDHIDHNPLNNHPDNLVAKSQHQNTQNCSLSKNNKTGVNGVYFCKRINRFISQIRYNKKTIHLGTYKLLLEAKKARRAAEVLYNYHPNHGKTI